MNVGKYTRWNVFLVFIIFMALPKTSVHARMTTIVYTKNTGEIKSIFNTSKKINPGLNFDILQTNIPTTMELSKFRIDIKTKKIIHKDFLKIRGDTLCDANGMDTGKLIIEKVDINGNKKTSFTDSEYITLRIIEIIFDPKTGLVIPTRGQPLEYGLTLKKGGVYYILESQGIPGKYLALVSGTNLIGESILIEYK